MTVIVPDASQRRESTEDAAMGLVIPRRRSKIKATKRRPLRYRGLPSKPGKKVSNLWEIPTVIVDEYLDKAIDRASFEKLSDGTWYAEIEGFKGLWASGYDQDACRRTLREVLVDWLSQKLRDADRDIPELDGINLPTAG